MLQVLSKSLGDAKKYATRTALYCKEIWKRNSNFLKKRKHYIKKLFEIHILKDPIRAAYKILGP